LPPSQSSLDSLELATATYEANVHLAASFLAERGLTSPGIADTWRLGVVVDPLPAHESMVGRLAIPSIGVRGVVSLRFRCLEHHDCKMSEHGKYLGQSNAPTRVFNGRALHTAGSFIAIAEGELDAIALNESDIPAVAIVGANNWKAHHSRLFAGFSKVYVCGDGDKAGRDFAAKVSLSVPTSTLVNMRQGQDIGDVFQAEGAEGVRALIGIPGA